MIKDEEESEIEELSTLLNRTRQKKFVKYFKQLPSEELVLQRKFLYTYTLNLLEN
jgi:hypothetical protein